MDKEIEIMNDSIIYLIQKYVDDYNSQEHPFLLFDPAHVNENDHTRVLLSILKYNNCQFLHSFLQTIHAPKFKEIKDPPTAQKPAIGEKGKGFIDLYFEYFSQNNQTETEKFIIENKIYGADDTKYQLARYIATVIYPDKNNDDFLNDIWNNWKENKDGINNGNAINDFTHIHVVYLTADGSKKPSLNSLPKYFGGRDKDESDFDENNMKINYYPVNYVDDIIPWLENDVLPNMTYSDNGIAIAGILQYIASLKLMFSNKDISDAVKEIVEETLNDYKKLTDTISILRSLANRKYDDENVKNIKDSLDAIGYDVDKLILQPLIRELSVKFNKLYSFSLNNGWQSYFTPSFVLLFKDSWWSESDIKKGYNFPSIHINCSPTKSFFESPKNITYKIIADHLPTNTEIVDLNNKWQFVGNRNRTISKKLQLSCSEQTDDYKKFINNIVRILDKKVKTEEIDKIIEDSKKKKESYQVTILNNNKQ